LYRYRLGRLEAGPVPLENRNLEARADGATGEQHLAVKGHDLAVTAHDETLYVVDQAGKQAIAFAIEITRGPLAVVGRPDFYPLHAYGGRALVAAEKLTSETGVFYDVMGGDAAQDAKLDWVGLHAIDQPRYDTSATLILGSPAGLPTSPPQFFLYFD